MRCSTLLDAARRGVALVRVLAARELIAEQVGHVVEDRLHPRVELLVLVAGQIADVAPQRHDRPGAEELLVDLLVERLGHAGGDGHQRLAGAGRADQADELHRVVQQQVQRHRLLEVAREDSEHRPAPRAHGRQRARVGLEARQGGVGGVLLVLEQHELVGQQRPAGQVEPAGLELLLGEQPVDHLPRHERLAPARVEAVEVDLLGLEVFGDQAQRVALDAGVDVLADEDDGRALLLQGQRAADDAVVRRVGGQAGAELLVFLEDDAHAPAGLRDGHAVGEVALLSQRVEQPDGRPRVAAEVVGAALELVELLDHVERDDDLVLLEHVQRVGVVQQDVGVDDEVLGVAVVVHVVKSRGQGSGVGGRESGAERRGRIDLGTHRANGRVQADRLYDVGTSAVRNRVRGADASTRGSWPLTPGS